MSENVLVDNLNKRVLDLQGQLDRVNAESKGRKDKLRKMTETVTALTKERDDALKGSGDLVKERDTLKARVDAAPGELQKTIDELKDKLRTRDHQARFNELLKDQVIDDPAAVTAAWKAAEYKAESDEPDEVKLQEAIGRAREALPFAFKTSQTGQAAADAAKKAPLQIGTGAGRGTPEKTQGSYRVTRSQLANPEYAMRNQKAIAEAGRNGTLQITEG